MRKKKKIVIVVGARPNFMKAFPVYEALKNDFELLVIHTGQHFDEKMSDVFFKQLKFPKPDFHFELKSDSKAGQYFDLLYANKDLVKQKDTIIDKLINSKGTESGQLGEARDKLIEVLAHKHPDLVMVFGDVTSTLAASLAAKHLGIALAHVEAGLRSGDLSMQEEVNRILTDKLSNLCFATEKSGVDNLVAEGKEERHIYLVGNTMIDTQRKYLQQALQTNHHLKLGLHSKEYVLITLHRPKNVDHPGKLKSIVDDIIQLSDKYRIVYPVHHRTKKKLEEINYLHYLIDQENIILTEALGYLEFTCLLANCKFVITDSGGLQEESTALNIPCFTLRPNTERPSTLIENDGTNQLINHINEIKLGACKNSMALWDGNSSERIRDILVKELN